MKKMSPQLDGKEDLAVEHIAEDGVARDLQEGRNLLEKL